LENIPKSAALAEEFIGSKRIDYWSKLRLLAFFFLNHLDHKILNVFIGKILQFKITLAAFIL